MKSKEEIEQLAKLKYSYEYGIETNVTDDLRRCFIEAYTQCQKDMVDKIKEAYEQGLSDGFACMPSTISPLNKQD
jgi:hypothetical protein